MTNINEYDELPEVHLYRKKNNPSLYDLWIDNSCYPERNEAEIITLIKGHVLAPTNNAGKEGET